MEKSQGPNSFEGPPRAEYGGADAVEKTSYVVGDGTNPHAMDEPGPSARVAAGGGFPAWALVLVAVVLAVLLVYLMAI